ncbi:hypothetical protein [Plantactinospora endophytica]|uniref:Uncharacterized protein n=1 Tax=Plantactinospora endophytica TaxID=673535 RepID=A0ABQ4EEB0_9ACTN|nr:hypothetical protein Pen02_79410 [Plantactinospora endophytica]
MGQDDDPRGVRLLNAVVAAFGSLEEFGFQIAHPRIGGGRGAQVLVGSDDVAIDVTADWYDRELSVAIKVAGADWLPIARLLPELSAAMRPLPCNARRGVMQKRLERISTGLRLNAPEVLAGGSAALARVLRAGAGRE